MLWVCLGSWILVALCRAQSATGNETTWFQILEPDSLRIKQGYVHRQATFGTAPEGLGLTGLVVYAGSQMCDDSDMEAFYNLTQGDWMLLVDRGDCSFVSKARRAQTVGASVALIGDNKCVCSYESVCESNLACQRALPFMVDDGSGDDIEIPTILLLKQDADALQDAITAGTTVRGHVEWRIPALDERVEWEIWHHPGDPAISDFGQAFLDTMDKLGDRHHFTPHFYLLNGTAIDCRGRAACNTYCTNGNRYCVEELYYYALTGRARNGADIVTEVLRQICAWRVVSTPRHWWTYKALFTATCEGYAFGDANCVSNALLAAGINESDITACIQQSGGLESDQPNTILDQEIVEGDNRDLAMASSMRPDTRVNGHEVWGGLSPSHVLSTICNSYADDDEEYPIPPVCVCVDADHYHEDQPGPYEECVEQAASISNDSATCTGTYYRVECNAGTLGIATECEELECANCNLTHTFENNLTCDDVNGSMVRTPFPLATPHFHASQALSCNGDILTVTDCQTGLTIDWLSANDCMCNDTLNVIMPPLPETPEIPPEDAEASINATVNATNTTHESPVDFDRGNATINTTNVTSGSPNIDANVTGVNTTANSTNATGGTPAADTDDNSTPAMDDPTDDAGSTDTDDATDDAGSPSTDDPTDDTGSPGTDDATDDAVPPDTNPPGIDYDDLGSDPIGTRDDPSPNTSSDSKKKSRDNAMIPIVVVVVLVVLVIVSATAAVCCWPRSKRELPPSTNLGKELAVETVTMPAHEHTQKYNEKNADKDVALAML